MLFEIGDVKLGDEPEGPNPGLLTADWHKSNIVEVMQIPGKGKKFITMQMSDKSAITTGTLWECDLVVRSVGEQRYIALKQLVEDVGPFAHRSYHGQFNVYVIDGKSHHKAGELEPPLRTDDGKDFGMVAEWTLKLLEAND